MNLGQLYEIATVFYNLEKIDVRVLESHNDTGGGTTAPIQLDSKTVVVKYRLDFDNTEYVSDYCIYILYIAIAHITN